MNRKQVIKFRQNQNQIQRRLNQWETENFIDRLWNKDPSLWPAKDASEITDRLGWLFLLDDEQNKLKKIVDFAEEIKKEGTSRVVVIGMGGSSLAAEVFEKTWGGGRGYPELTVLDSTHPEVICSLEEAIDLSSTLFVVSSKSGTTLETLSLFYYFWKRVKQISKKPGDRFCAITDHGSPLEQLGLKRNFRKIFNAPTDVGGRFSALSDFGLVPAALMGVDIQGLVEKAKLDFRELDKGLEIGAVLSEMNGRKDKMTFLTSPSLKNFPIWLEQLISESLGKNEKGIVPVIDEPLVPIGHYGKDRFFVNLFLKGEERGETAKRTKLFEDSGFPSIQIAVDDLIDLGREMFLWELGIASAGAALSINPFNQPNVQLTKDKTKRFIETNQKNSSNDRLNESHSLNKKEPLIDAVDQWLSYTRDDYYIGIQAYLFPSPEITKSIQELRLKLLEKTHIATTVGYGPRFLHSTGQMHKGGPSGALFLQLIDNPEKNISIPETNFSFKDLIHAQSFGDYCALKERRRTILRIDLNNDAIGGLERLKNLITERL